MKIYTLLYVFLLALLASFNTVFADDEAPESIVKKYYSAIQQSKFNEAASMIREQDLLELRREVLLALKYEKDNGQRTFLRSQFGPNASYNEIQALTATAMFRDLLEYIFNKNKNKNNENIVQAVKIIGSIREPETTMYHVLSRNRGIYGGINTEVLEVTTVVSQDGHWKLLIPPKMMAMGKRMQSIIEHRLTNAKMRHSSCVDGP